MSKRYVPLGILVAGVLSLSACATVSGVGAAEPTRDPSAPAQVDLKEWDGVRGAQMISADTAGPTTVEGMVAESELVVVVRVVDQGPFLDHDIIATESTLEIVEVLGGDPPADDPRLYTIGKPVYLEGYYDVEGVADPPLFDEPYVMFLARYPEVPNSAGKLVPVDNVWIAVGHGGFVEEASGSLRWDGDNRMPPITMDELRAIING